MSIGLFGAELNSLVVPPRSSRCLSIDQGACFAKAIFAETARIIELRSTMHRLHAAGDATRGAQYRQLPTNRAQLRDPDLMDAQTRRMVEFVRARIAEDRALARVARRGFAGETDVAAASAGHTHFSTRFNPDWVIDDCFRKLMLLRAEVLRGAAVETTPGDDTYQYPVVVLLASAWLKHPDYEPAWV